MTFVMSDIHGEYEKFKEMLNLINFNDDDTLYILGDIVDRGSEPIAIIQNIMNRANVFPVMGNHDLLAHDVLRKLSVDITEDNCQTQVDMAVMEELLDWMSNGGEPTMKQFSKLQKSERQEILDYISDFPLCEIVEIQDKAFILVHAGLGNFREDKKLSEYTPEELLLSRNNPDEQRFSDPDIYIVSGHTPTLNITGKAEIYKSCNNICIDCGAAFGGRLGCLCLETMEEFYV